MPTRRLLWWSLVCSSFILALLQGPGAAQDLSPRAYLPVISGGDAPAILIAAIYPDTYVPYEPDEAIQLWNAGSVPVNLSGWRLSDGTREAILPPITVPAGGYVWCARQAQAFEASFGHEPDCEWDADTDPGVPNAIGESLRLANRGGFITLSSPGGRQVDAVAYGDVVPGPGWSGPTVQPYARGSFGTEGQILYRKLDARGQPVVDTDSAADWALDPEDEVNGRKVRYPGWDLEPLWTPVTVTAPAAVTVTVTPDNALPAILDAIGRARSSVWVEMYTLESVPVGMALAERAAAGVDVRILLEGDPAGGLTDLQRWIVARLADAGAKVYYMVNDRDDARDRYRYLHAKLMVVDQRLAMIGSENFSPDALPADPQEDGTAGRRGVLLFTDARPIVERAATLFQLDCDPLHHRDIWPWDPDDPKYGRPPDGFEPSPEENRWGYAVRWPQPLGVHGGFTMSFLTAPEAGIRHDVGVYALVEGAGPGDEVLVEQLYEHHHWGDLSSDPVQDPNPRLDAYLDAARRGARVRLLLDGYFDDPESPRSNRATAEMLNAIAQAEGLDLEARLGNPTCFGLHNKMLLVRSADRQWVHVGSLNGSEVSAKENREVMLEVASAAIYEYLSGVFWDDWSRSGDGSSCW